MTAIRNLGLYYYIMMIDFFIKLLMNRIDNIMMMDFFLKILMGKITIS